MSLYAISLKDMHTGSEVLKDKSALLPQHNFILIKLYSIAVLFVNKKILTSKHLAIVHRSRSADKLCSCPGGVYMRAADLMIGAAHRYRYFFEVHADQGVSYVKSCVRANFFYCYRI